jgi:hypothetical protein
VLAKPWKFVSDFYYGNGSVDDIELKRKKKSESDYSSRHRSRRSPGVLAYQFPAFMCPMFINYLNS